MATTTSADGPVRDLVDQLGPGPVQQIVYRRQLVRALNVKVRAGLISNQEYRRIRAASYNPIYMDAFIDEVVNAAKVAGDWLEDLQAWFQKLYDWMIENWDTVLKIALTLLMFAI